MRTSRAAALVVATLVTAGVLGGYAVHAHSDGTAHASGTPSSSPAVSPTPSVSGTSSPTPSPTRPAVLGRLSSTAPEPTPSAVGGALSRDAGLAAKGARLVGEVIDGRTGAVLWSRGRTTAAPPASTTKLLTAAAALTALGPNAHLKTTTRLSGRTVYLVGGGDPTIVLDRRSYLSPSYPQPATLAALAHETVQALGTTRRVRLRLDASAWSGPTAAVGWKPSYVTEGDVTPPSALELDEGRIDPESEFASRSPTPTAQAGDAFADLLQADGVKLVGRTRLGTAPVTSRALASVSSPTIAALVQRMLTVSDDDLAEALGRAVALHDHLPGTFAGAASAVRARVSALGVPVAGVSLKDTSGLSHRDRVTPAALVDVLRLAGSAAHPQLRSLLAGLPIAGLTGTLADRFDTPSTSKAAGVLRAKTGTLTGVNALAGAVVDRSGRQLIFAFLASHATLPGLTVPAIDRLAARLGQCGCTG